MGDFVKEDRQKLWKSYQGLKPPYIAHAWLKYDRYYEARNIIRTLVEHNEDFKKLSVLDFGCGVGDYGFQFGREGSKVTFFDLDEEIDFLMYRVAHELINAKFLRVNQDFPFDKFYDVVIFGEVLEHLDDPLATLFECVKNKVRYIFTSSYPYRSDDPNDAYWKHRGHLYHKEICELQKPCRELLLKNYDFVKYDGEARLWYKK